MSDLDQELLGRKFPGNPSQRMLLLKKLLKLVEAHGEKWVKDCRERLLSEAQIMLDFKILR